VVSSSGVTLEVPSASAGTASSSDTMPSLCAVLATAPGPTSEVNCAATEFDDFANARVKLIMPSK